MGGETRMYPHPAENDRGPDAGLNVSKAVETVRELQVADNMACRQLTMAWEPSALSRYRQG